MFPRFRLAASVRWLLVSTVMVAVFCSCASAQSRPSPAKTVSGTVMDPSGAVIVGATVTLSNDKGQSCGTTKTNGSGRFSLASCGANQSLVVRHAGFSEVQQRVTNANAGDLQVTLGIATESVGVEVSAESVEVSTDTAANTNTTQIDSDSMNKLPVLDQDYITMMSDFLDPSALGTGGVALVVNGVEANGPGVSSSAVQTVKINNNPYSALFSRPGRARLEIVTKGGTPKIHGEVNGSARNSVFDATPAYATSKPDEQRRYFEGNLTGPLGSSPQNTFLASADYDDLSSQAVVNAVTPAGPVHETVPTPQKHFFGSFRAFHDYGKGNQFWIGYSYEWGVQQNRGVGGTTLPEAGYQSRMFEHEINASHTYVINDRWLNQARGLVGHNVDPHLTSNQPGQAVEVLGTFTGGSAQLDSKRTETHFDGNDTLIYSAGKHEVKFGVDVPDVSRRGADDFTYQGGYYTFGTLAAYAAGTPQTLLLQQGNGHLVFLESTFALFGEDTYRIKPNFTLTYGARYYFQKYFHNDGNNVAPRLGFAWSPGAQRKLVIRGGSGVFFDRSGPRPIADLLHFNGVDLRRYVIDNPTFPNLPATAGLPISEVVLDPRAAIPYIVQYGLGLEQQIGKKSVFSAEWVGTRGYKLFRSIDGNAPAPPFYTTRPDAALGQLRTMQSSGHSRGNSMQLSFRSSASKWVTMQAQYQLSKTYSDTEGINFFPSNSYFPGLDYARASFDQRHHFTLLGTLKLPADLTAGTSLSIHSARPYNETTGADNNLDGILNDRPAGVPRNSLHGAGHIHLDVRLGRDFHLRAPTAGDKDKDAGGGEGIVLNTSVSAFNVLNHRNDTGFVGVTTSPFFGRATSADSPRRLQFNASLKF